MPEMNYGFEVVDGKPNLVKPAHVNLGLAIDLQKPDGTRQLLVPSIKAAETMDFAAVLVGLRGHRPAGPRQQARPSTTSRAPRSASPTPARSAPTTRCRG